MSGSTSATPCTPWPSRATTASLTFVPLEQELDLGPDALASALAGLRVPADERGRFLRSVVPGLRQRLRVRSEVPLPAPEPAEDVRPEVVTVHVRVVSDVPGELRLDLGHAYDGVPRPFTTARFGTVGGRDRDAESAAVQAATSLRSVPGALRADLGGHAYLVPRVVLTGLPAARFVADTLALLEADEHVTVEVDGDVPAYEEVTSAPVVRLGTGERREQADPGDWFDLRVSVEVDGEEVPFEPLFGALARGDEIMLLDSGAFFRLDRPELLRLRDLIEEARDIADPETGGLRLSAHHADLWDELVALGVVDEQSARWAANVEALGSPRVRAARRGPARPPGHAAALPARRLPVARAPLGRPASAASSPTTWAWARRSRSSRPSSAPTTGASSAATAPSPRPGPRRRADERRRHVDGRARDLRARTCASVAVTATERKRGVSLADTVAGAEVVITSYAVLRLDDAAFHAVRWGGVVLDEAQFVKNRQAKTHVAVRRLGAPFTVAVTGTPLENSLMDLWSLLSLTAPGLYPRPDVFTKNYRKPIESGERPELLDLLRRRIRPLMLRRTKEQVAIDLPPKQIQVMALDPHPVHRHIYDQHLQRERQRVLGLLDDPESNRVAILARADPAAPARPRPRPRRRGPRRQGDRRQDRVPRRPAARARRRGPPGPRLQPVHRLPAHRRGRADARGASTRHTSTGRRPTGRPSSRGFREGDARRRSSSASRPAASG